MKNLVIAVFVFFIAAQIFAQAVSLSSAGNNRENQFYVDLVGKTAALNGNWGLFGGMKAGYNIDKNIGVGLAGHGMIPNHLGGSYINQKGRDTLHFGYGGLDVSYKHNISEKFSLAGIMLIGAGRVDYANLDGYDYFFIVEPGVSANYMITDWFGLGVSADYRFASGVKYADFSNASFSGWSTDISFKFAF